MNRHWKEFTVITSASRKEVYASVHPRGKIVLNKLLWTELGSPKFVSLLYDEDNLTIGIRPSSRTMPNSFTVVARPDGTNFWIHAKPFLTAAALDIAYCIRFLDPHIEHDTLILDLNHTARVMANRRGSED